MTTYPSFVINVLLVGRPEPITSPAFEDREAAESDLKELQDARVGNREVSLPWINMAGSMVQVAYIEDRTIHA